MSDLLIILLAIWALIGWAMAITFWRAWRDALQWVDHLAEDLDWIPEDV